MAGWLGHWLRDIVLIVLFAAFVDLLVPNNALQKYVKITISLMILLTILAPLIELLKPDLDIREAAFAAIESGSSGIAPLSSVLEAGGRLRLEAESRAARLTEVQIAEQIRRQVSGAFPVTAQAVDVRIGPGEREGMAEIEGVRVVIRRPAREEDSVPPEPADEGPAARVPPVDRVTAVAVAVSAREDARGQASGARERDKTPEGRLEADGEKRLAAEVAEQVGIWWGIDSTRIEVIWAEEGD